MRMKLTALIFAAVLAALLAGCAASAPDTVGSMGGVEISSGLYLLAQYDAYQRAADLAGEGQDASNVKAYLKQTVTIDEESGETALVSDYVAEKTLENLRFYAAVEKRFDELGGSLTQAEEAEADSYARQLYEQNSDIYKANGINLDTVRRLELIMLKSNALLELEYGPNGAKPVSDAEFEEFMRDNAAYVLYMMAPLYNTETYAFADDRQKAYMLSLADEAMAAYNSAVPGGSAEQREKFEATVEGVMPDICAVLSAEYAQGSEGFSAALLTRSALEEALPSAADAEKILSLKNGEAAAVQYEGYAIMLLLRLDPSEAEDFDSLRKTALAEMKGDELAQAVRSYGARLENALDADAVAKIPEGKIKAAQ